MPTEYRSGYLEDRNWYLITNSIPIAAIFNLSPTQAEKPEPEAKPALQLKISHSFTRC